MSLLATASPWINDDSSKKRTSTMRKTIKKILPLSSSSQLDRTDESSEPTNDSSLYENFDQFQHQAVPTIEDSEAVHENRKSKINELLNKITSISADNDGSKLANYNPPPNPIINNKRPDPTIRTSDNELTPSELLPVNKLQPSTTYEHPHMMKSSGGASFASNDIPLGKYTNYNKGYEPSDVTNKPYYAKMGISANSSLDDRVMEKINYMIHLLEEQQHEKTNNITEEFILYTLLGVFMIFVLDSFSKSGKYVR